MSSLSSFIATVPGIATLPGRIIAGAVVATLVLGTIVVARLGAAPASVAPRTAPVTRASVTQTVSISGSINPAAQVRLNFRSAGRLAEVLVAVGQAVATDQALARLDTADLQVALSQAKANLASAQAKHEQTLAGASPEDVAVARQAVDNAQRSHEQTRKTTQSDQASAQQALDNATRSLEQTQKTTQNDISTALQALTKAKTNFAAAKENFASLAMALRADVAAYQTDLGMARSQLTKARDDLELVVRTGDVAGARTSLNSADVSLAAAETYARSTLEAALTEFARTESALRTAVAAFESAVSSTSADTASASSAYQSAQTAYQSAANRLSSALDAPATQISAAQTSISAAQSSLSSLTSRSDATLDTARSDVVALQTSLAAEQQLGTTIKGKIGQAGGALATVTEAVSGSYVAAQQSYASALAKAETSVQSAQQALTSAQNSVSATQEKSAATLLSQQNALASAQVSLQKTSAAPRSFEIATAYAGVLVQQAALEKATNDLANATLRAPTAGLVASINAQVGEFVSGGGTASPFIVVANTSALTLHGTVGESEVVTLKVGQVATVTVDAIGTTRMTGKVTALDPVATIQQGVPVYGVDVRIDRADPAVRPGMSGTANVLIASKQDVLVVPNLAIRSQGGRRFVQVLRDGQTADAEVTFGISNDTVTEVTGGLEEGDVVVLPTPRAVTTQPGGGAQLIGGPGGGGGAGGGRVPPPGFQGR